MRQIAKVNLKQHVTVEFAYNSPGRPPHALYENYITMMHIGRTVWKAMLEKNVQCPA